MVVDKYPTITASINESKTQPGLSFLDLSLGENTITVGSYWLLGVSKLNESVPHYKCNDVKSALYFVEMEFFGKN